jgi:hypothetical protein
MKPAMYQKLAEDSKPNSLVIFKIQTYRIIIVVVVWRLLFLLQISLSSTISVSPANINVCTIRKSKCFTLFVVHLDKTSVNQEFKVNSNIPKSWLENRSIFHGKSCCDLEDFLVIYAYNKISKSSTFGPLSCSSFVLTRSE